ARRACSSLHFAAVPLGSRCLCLITVYTGGGGQVLGGAPSVLGGAGKHVMGVEAGKINLTTLLLNQSFSLEKNHPCFQAHKTFNEAASLIQYFILVYRRSLVRK
ncbi:hypothetical protein BaRGS_00036757, partial [Batillaria attramentaria]